MDEKLTRIACAQRLVKFIKSLPDFQWTNERYEPYEHMGATITDAGLQAGVNYLNVVFPRVKRLLANWPNAKTTSGFLAEISRWGLDKMLCWTHPDKPRRIYEIAVLFVNNKIETEMELLEWLTVVPNRKMLLGIRGIGPKTVGYLFKLVGGPAIAIDRHLIRFASMAGLPNRGYDEMEKIFQFAADILCVDYSSLDNMIWTYVVNSPKSLKKYFP